MNVTVTLILGKPLSLFFFFYLIFLRRTAYTRGFYFYFSNTTQHHASDRPRYLRHLHPRALASSGHTGSLYYSSFYLCENVFCFDPRVHGRKTRTKMPYLHAHAFCTEQQRLQMKHCPRELTFSTSWLSDS